MKGPTSLLVTPRLRGVCRVSHPLTRYPCARGDYSHDLHWTDERYQGGMWDSATGKTSSRLGWLYVTHFARFVAQPGHVADQVVEHFPNPAIMRSELAARITYGHGTSYAPGEGQRPLRFNHVSRDAYMDVWVLVSVDHAVHDPVPDPCTTRPVERWTVVGDYLTSQRSEYLPLTTPIPPRRTRT